VPGWHEATKELERQGKVRVAGIIEEQHPDRARLFMQWKRMGWPILVDSLNLIGVQAVPITLFIDEHGIIRRVNPPLKNAAAVTGEFLAERYEAPAAAAPAVAVDAANKLFLWGGEKKIGEAIDAYKARRQHASPDAAATFRLGVAYRRRYDSPQRQEGDFQAAIDHWQKALDLNPNQYIWRRRIQQYGPRLSKPYSFYDWVVTAREEIRARGEQPPPLVVEPGGAEFARPLKQFEAEGAAAEPDAAGRIHRDPGRFIRVETIAAPPSIAAGAATRFHAVFRPNQRIKAHWNNEAEGLVLWVNPPAGWSVNPRRVALENPREAVSLETRAIEFEALAPVEAAAGRITIPAYALYYVCEDVNGTCLFRRQDLRFTVSVQEKK